MGQAKQRGTFEQRRQKAIARNNHDAGPARLNELYRKPPFSPRKPGAAIAMTTTLALASILSAND